MMNITKKPRILWSLDPFDGATQPKSAALQEVARLQSQSGADMEAVYVSSEDSAAAIEATERALRDYLDAHGWSTIPSRVLRVSSSFRKGQVDALLEHAERTGADLILVNNSGKSFFSRLTLGSFTESLMLRSRIPVFVLENTDEAAGPLDHLLFATDFSEGARAAFEQVLALASRLHARVTLYHSINMLMLPGYQGGGVAASGWLPDESYLKQERALSEKEAEPWLERARELGVRTDLLIEEAPADVVDSIIEAARRTRAGWIALASQSTRLETFLLGSVAKQVLRRSPLPVWVCRPPLDSRPRAQVVIGI